MVTSKSSNSSKLSVDTTARSRKYRGDGADLHFIPRSPLISRQNLTLGQEEELLKACTRLLKGVPHSDESAVPDFKHLASHIIVEFPKVPDRTHVQHQVDKTSKPPTTSTSTKPKGRSHTRVGPAPRFSEDTATPSTISKHDFDDRTNVTTPLTSTTTSPHDVLLPITEKAAYLPVSQFCDLSQPQWTTKISQPTHTSAHRPTKPHRHSRSDASRSTKSTPSSRQVQADSLPKSKATKGLKKHFTKRPEYNKSLPDLPKLETFYQTSDDPWSTKNASFDIPRPQYRIDTSLPPPSSKLNKVPEVKIKEKTQSKSRFPFLAVFTRKAPA